MNYLIFMIIALWRGVRGSRYAILAAQCCCTLILGRTTYRNRGQRKHTWLSRSGTIASEASTRSVSITSIDVLPATVCTRVYSSSSSCANNDIDGHSGSMIVVVQRAYYSQKFNRSQQTNQTLNTLCYMQPCVIATINTILRMRYHVS